MPSSLPPEASLLPGELAWYVTGRFYRKGDGSAADYGYFLHLAGIDGGLFEGAPGETTAHFTFAAEPFLATPVSNGALNLSLDHVGDFSVYLQRQPQGDFGDPASFARGERIATFRRSSRVMGTALTADAGGSTVAVFSNNVFSARLIESRPFEFNGREHDLARSIGVGITQFGTAAAVALPPVPGYEDTVPFSGSAVALGRA